MFCGELFLITSKLTGQRNKVTERKIVSRTLGLMIFFHETIIFSSVCFSLVFNNFINLRIFTNINEFFQGYKYFFRLFQDSVSLRSWREWVRARNFCGEAANSLAGVAPFFSRPARLFALAFGTEVRAGTHSRRVRRLGFCLKLIKPRRYLFIHP